MEVEKKRKQKRRSNREAEMEDRINRRRKNVYEKAKFTIKNYSLHCDYQATIKQ